MGRWVSNVIVVLLVLSLLLLHVCGACLCCSGGASTCLSASRLSGFHVDTHFLHAAHRGQLLQSVHNSVVDTLDAGWEGAGG